eukprot:3713319-Pyramimonas_sp.AAC.1
MHGLINGSKDMATRPRTWGSIVHMVRHAVCKIRGLTAHANMTRSAPSAQEVRKQSACARKAVRLKFTTPPLGVDQNIFGRRRKQRL